MKDKEGGSLFSDDGRTLDARESSALAESPMPKNILLLTSDQQHWTMLGLQNAAVKTPNLDRLARSGLLADRAYCPNPTCTPTRASIITGQYPSQHGAWSLGTKLPEEVPTVGDVFRDAGYRSCLIGKGHLQPLQETEQYTSLEAYPHLQDLAFWREYEGPFYGFDDFELCRNHVDEAHVGQHYAMWMEEKGFTYWRECFQKPTGTAENQFLHWNLPEEYHYNTWITERSIDRMREYKESGTPFFLWASYPDPHPPYLVPEPWASMYDPNEIELPPKAEAEEIRRNPPPFQLTQEENPDYTPWEESGKGIHGYHSHRHKESFYTPGWDDEERQRKAVAVYYGMVSMMDHYIGKLLDYLEESGLAKETLVVFTSDHGHFFGQHGLIAKGAFHYEDGVRVPFIARHPDNPEGGRTEALISLVDLAPTFLEYAGIDIPVTMSGKSQLAVFAGKKESIRDHVLVENRHEFSTVYLETYIDRRYKLTVYWNCNYGELYDLEEDPGEVVNLWDDPAKAALKQELLLQFVHAEMAKAPPHMPRIAGA